MDRHKDKYFRDGSWYVVSLKLPKNIDKFAMYIIGDKLPEGLYIHIKTEPKGMEQYFYRHIFSDSLKCRSDIYHHIEPDCEIPYPKKIWIAVPCHFRFVYELNGIKIGKFPRRKQFEKLGICNYKAIEQIQYGLIDYFLDAFNKGK